MFTISNSTISNCGHQPIQAGTKWINCTFVNTPIEIESNQFEMVGCDITNCPISFYGSAVSHEKVILAYLAANNTIR